MPLLGVSQRSAQSFIMLAEERSQDCCQEGHQQNVATTLCPGALEQSCGFYKYILLSGFPKSNL